MTNFACDAYTGATPLAALKAGESVNVMNMIVGKTAGTIGETSVIALLIGACFLILIGVIDLRIPGTYIVTVILFAGIFGGHGFDPAYLSAQLAGGGLILVPFHGNGLCHQTDYHQGTVCIRCGTGTSYRNLPYLRTGSRGSPMPSF